MDNIEAVTLDDKVWTPLSPRVEPNSRAWTNGDDTLILRYFPLPPDIPAPLSRPDLIWKLGRLQNFWKQAAPVDVLTGKIGTAEYLSQIVKFSLNGRIHYQGSLIIPKSTFSLMFIVGSEVPPGDTKRDEYVEQIVLAGVTDVDERARRWFRDPFSFKFVTPISRSRADDEEWDAMFPGHALSRVRAIMRALPSICKIDPEILDAPAFVAPAATPSLERELEEFAAFFSVPPEEQQELDDLSRDLTLIIEKHVTESGKEASTEVLLGEQSWEDFANAIAKLVSNDQDRSLCLIMYSSKRDPTFYRSLGSRVSRQDRKMYLDQRLLQDVETMASKDPLQWEFMISRILRGINIRCVSVRSAAPDKCRTGVALIRADSTDWFAKFITLCEMASLIVCATMLNPNLGREWGIAFGLERNRAKSLYLSNDSKFHLGSEQEYAFDVRQLPEVAGYILAKKLGIQAEVRAVKE